MSERLIAARELAKLLNIFSHPQRIQIVEELKRGEKDVNHLKEELEIEPYGIRLFKPYGLSKR